MSVRAWAILRGHHVDHHITSNEVILGREEAKSSESEGKNFIQISSSKKISRKAAKIYYNEASE